MGLFDRLFGNKTKEKENEVRTDKTAPATTAAEPVKQLMAEAQNQPISDLEKAQSTSQSEAASSLERAVDILQDKEKRAAAIRAAEEKKAAETAQQVEEHTQKAQQPIQGTIPVSESATQSILQGTPTTSEQRESERTPANAAAASPVSELTETSPTASSERKLETSEEKYARTLKKTRTGFGAKLNAFFANFRIVDEEFFEELEEVLITSDVGVQVATQLTEDLRQEAKLEKVKGGEELRRLVIEKLVDIYEKDGDFEAEKIKFQPGLTVMLFVGVNGVGKTTSIGKLAHQYKQIGKKVMLAAADTFRAGAVAQLEEWARRVGVPIVTGPEKSDPASVVYDAMEKAVAEEVDVLMIDTAGRLQNKDNLMAELEKIGRIIKRVLPDAPHETLLALDASTGQNALVQAKEFSKIAPLTGLVLTKIDGTARGGVVLAIRQELDIPVKLIGFGEKIDDIGQFNSEDFMRGLLEGLL